MGLLLFLFVLFGAIPYAITQCLVNRKLWIGYAVLASLGLSYLWYDTKVHPDMSSPGGQFAEPILWALSIATVTGLITQLIKLCAIQTVNRKALATCVGLCLVGLMWVMPEVINNWRHRPQSAECKYDAVQVDMRDKHFSIPGVAFLKFSIIANKETSVKDFLKYYYGLEYPTELRKYCNDFDDGRKAVKAGMISFEISDLFVHDSPEQIDRSCAMSEASWLKDICRNIDAVRTKFHEIRIYDNEKFDAGRMFALSRLSSVNFDQGKANKKSNLKGFSFDGQNYYWADTANKDYTGKPIIAVCSTYVPDQALSCGVNYAISDNLYVIYEYNLTNGHYAQEIAAKNVWVRDLISSIENK